MAARHAGDWIEVTVDDEGIGIAPGDHERIFERFVQGETGDRRRFGGIGLGLYIVRQLARAQGGEVAASSRRGRGHPHAAPAAPRGPLNSGRLPPGRYPARPGHLPRNGTSTSGQAIRAEPGKVV